MMFRLLSVLLLTFALAGCVLESAKPLFPDQQGVLALEGLGTRFAAEVFENGAWKRQDNSITLTAEGRHYLGMSSEENSRPADFLLLPMEGSRHLLQMSEEGRSSGYVVVEIKDGTVLLQPVFCDEIKLPPDAASWISFSGTDCKVIGQPGLEDFTRLAEKLAPAKMRLVAVE